jgi:hypothetical protein
VFEDFKLSLAQVGRELRRYVVGFNELFDNPPGDAWIENGTTGDGFAYSGGDLVGVGILEQEAGCARPQGSVDEVVGVKGRQDDHLRRFTGGLEPLGRLDPVHDGHANVH